MSATRTDTGDTVLVSANFLWMCQGYYRHAEGYTPEWPGMDTFEGEIVHPQTWPEDLDYRDKEVIVIGSGATAATLVPAIADDAQHVTILQRSPTYYFTGENRNLLADHLRELEVPEEWVHDIVRRENLFNLRALTQFALEEPEFAKAALIDLVRAALPPDFDVETHFTPRYMPWRQRIAFLPDGDLFKSISAGQASIVTDEIETFTAQGVRLKSGGELDADIIVTATGFNLSVLGDISFSIDGAPLDFADTVTYRGMMFSGVPNLVWVFGYFRASWTLRVDLVSDFVNRMLLHMDERRCQASHAATARRRPRRALAGVGRRGVLQSELPDALDAPHAEATREAGVAPHAGLLGRARRTALGRPRRGLSGLRMKIRCPSPLTVRSSCTTRPSEYRATVRCCW